MVLFLSRMTIIMVTSTNRGDNQHKIGNHTIHVTKHGDKKCPNIPIGEHTEDSQKTLNSLALEASTIIKPIKFNNVLKDHAKYKFVSHATPGFSRDISFKKLFDCPL